jgi:hypothetical protein
MVVTEVSAEHYIDRKLNKVRMRRPDKPDRDRCW